MHSLIACILFIFIRPLISINTEITGSLENASLETEQIDPVSNDLKKNNENSSAGYFAQQSRTPHIFSHVKHFQLVCCMGGIPQLSHPELARNFNIEKSISYTIAKDKEYDNTANFDSNADCRLFRGSFMVPQPRLLLGLPIELSYTSNIVCKCPELTLGHALDRSCRRLPSCQNNGFRSLLDPKQCFCLEPFFGERCERICDRGRRLRGMDGRDYCNCLPFYHGIECREPICLNGGRSLFDARGCECLPPFIGFHCEFDGNRTQRFEFEANVGNAGARSAGNSRFRHNFDSSENVGEMFSTRDISGTVFSIVMIIVLVLSMYMLMKHRMVQTRHMNRRTDLLGACNIPPSLESSGGTNEFVSSFPANFTLRDENNQVRRLELLPHAEESVMATGLGRYSLPPLMRRLTPFFTSGDNPPPYALNQRAQRSRNLPPLPSYEDATKLPAIRTELRDENTHLGVQEHQELCSSELTNESRIQINHQSQAEENNVEPINDGNIERELSELLDVNKNKTTPIK